MSQPDDPPPTKDALKPKHSRVEEARRIIEEYAEELREIIRKLRHRLH
jgi:hypothetical protein